ncbi:MAG: hypothetical protein ACREP0_11010 [Rhodanobacteraceae bacterium]
MQRWTVVGDSNGIQRACIVIELALIAREIDRALDRASTELTTRNITISHHDGNITEPKAEITPAGDLLIAGKPVALTPAQRKDVLAYRQQLIEMGRQGIAVGRQGATLGLHAATEALAAAFSGQSEQQIRAHVEANASGIRQAADKMCAEMPALMASQQRLAAEVPPFKPYADLTPARIRQCRADVSKHGGDD